jgi:hypothetical protein
MLHKRTLLAFAAAVTLGCMPIATNALAAGHPGGGRAGGGHAIAGSTRGGHAMAGAVRGGRATAGYARGGGTAGYARGGRFARSGGGYYGSGPVYGGPIYDSCDGYGYGYGNSGCPGYGVPLVGGVINGIIGGYGY